MRKVDDRGKNILFRGLFAVQERYMLFQGVIWMPRRVIYCSWGLYAVRGDHMLFTRVILMFRKILYCSGGLYAVQDGYILFRRVKWMFRRVIYMLKKIMMFLVATNVVASRPPECRPTGTPPTRANLWY